MKGTDGCIRYVLSTDGELVKVVDDCYEYTGMYIVDC